MKLKLIANSLVADDEIWVSHKTWDRPFVDMPGHETRIKEKIAKLIPEIIAAYGLESEENFMNCMEELRKISEESEE